MLLLRAVLLEFLVCFHVIGAAALFRRLLPKESPWLAFIVPTLGVMAVFNFIEHYVALPMLGWLLPISMGGLLWSMIRPGYTWEGLRFPAVLFVLVFTWALAIKCMNPEITCNTEGVADMARVADFCLGDKLPPVDTWCPPYDHGGYYSFQHYGASLLKRLFSLDIGTGYNMGYTLLNTLTCLVGAGAAYRISGNRIWVALATLLVLLGNFTGSAPYLLFRNSANPDFQLSVDIGESWSDPHRNPFGWIMAGGGHPVLRLFTPTFNLYFAEFHANLGGHFLTLASLLAANEAFQPQRSNAPWICLLVFPLISIIMATWFFIVVSVLCGGSLLAALLARRRPDNWRYVVLGAGAVAMLLWPSVDSLIAGAYPVAFFWIWAPDMYQYHTPLLEFAIQWWPVWVPWLLLCFIWLRLSLIARWVHAAIPLLLIFVELATFGDRGLTVEKMWGALYGAGLVTFLPLVFIQRGLIFRLTTVVFLFISVIFIATWAKLKSDWVDWHGVAFHLQGDTVFQNDTQKRRLLQVLKSLHGQTILPGKSQWAYNETPSIIGFSENRCYIAWFYQEYQCGHGGEAEYRDRLTNEFYAGKMADPLPFLRNNNIAAVLIWPGDGIDPADAMPDAILTQLKSQIGSDYYYVDCKMDGPFNAGVFLRQPASVAAFPPSLPVAPAVTAAPAAPSPVR